MKWFVLLGVAVASVVSVSAQVPQRPLAGARRGAPGALGQENGITPVEIQRMFDAYALLQAQEQLSIDDDQFTQFLTRFRALQDVRRKALQERGRIIQELRRMFNAGQPDESQIKDRLKMLDEVDVHAAVEAKKAYDAIDQVLDVRQQARFRIFEEVMERRKIDLVTRARLANRPKP